uniref:Uncharacterized protein n=1 Tax=Oryza brachyantha TaxID=4533 RepID=J3M6P9_ORYBR
MGVGQLYILRDDNVLPIPDGYIPVAIPNVVGVMTRSSLGDEGGCVGEMTRSPLGNNNLDDEGGHGCYGDEIITRWRMWMWPTWSRDHHSAVTVSAAKVDVADVVMRSPQGDKISVTKVDIASVVMGSPLSGEHLSGNGS